MPARPKKPEKKKKKGIGAYLSGPVAVLALLAGLVMIAAIFGYLFNLQDVVQEF